MTEMINKRVWLTPKGQKKVVGNYIYTTDEKIVAKPPYIIVTNTDDSKTYILDQDDISQIED